MAIIKINTVNQKADINQLIDDSHDELALIKHQLAEAPIKMTAYENFLKILRHIKRTGNVDQALAVYAVESCPPCEHYDEADYCSTIGCAECWREFYQSQINKLSEKEKDE